MIKLHERNNSMNKYTLKYWQEDEYFVGKLIEVPGVHSQGKDLDELIANIKEAYELMIEDDELIENSHLLKLEI